MYTLLGKHDRINKRQVFHKIYETNETLETPKIKSI